MQPVQMYTIASCPFCERAKKLLAKHQVNCIEEIRIDTDHKARQTMMARTGRRTVPQIFIGQTHVGGSDDLFALDQAGKLIPLLLSDTSPT